METTRRCDHGVRAARALSLATGLSHRVVDADGRVVPPPERAGVRLPVAVSAHVARLRRLRLLAPARRRVPHVPVPRGGVRAPAMDRHARVVRRRSTGETERLRLAVRARSGPRGVRSRRLRRGRAPRHVHAVRVRGVAAAALTPPPLARRVTTYQIRFGRDQCRCPVSMQAYDHFRRILESQDIRPYFPDIHCMDQRNCFFG